MLGTAPTGDRLAIDGELKKISAKISHSTVKTILKQRGILPPPEKGKRKGGPDGTWRKFIAGHLETTVSMDYFTSTLTTLRGIALAYSFVFIHYATRRVWLSQPTLNPDEKWNIMQLKGAVWWFEDQSIEIKYMIRDRDKKYSEKFVYREAG